MFLQYRPLAIYALFALVLSGCDTVPQHQSTLMPHHIELKEVSVVSIVPTSELTARREFALEGKVGAGGGYVAALCPVCALPLMAAASADKANQENTQAQEDADLFSNLLSQLGSDYTRKAWENGLRSAVNVAKDISASRVEVIDPLAIPELESKLASGKTHSMLLLELEHYLSNNLDKLRMQVRARLFDEKGNQVYEQYYYFLPFSVPGLTKAEAIGNWAANNGALYRLITELGVTGLQDALQLTILSFKSGSNSREVDASGLLARRSCFAGDYEVGVPLSAYDKGTLIASRENYSIVRLSNRDILVIAACDR